MNKILEEIKAISGAIGFNYLPKEKRQVTFYSEGKNYWPHLQG
ncbi:MAG: CDP-glycerol--glycerophosphate glycerophosphotransferase, partial [Pelagibacterales bacterium]|nr:CDP-glycerol--glycerophosphate glycerophosphotransferase [Pelagibacterales bacterium]